MGMRPLLRRVKRSLISVEPSPGISRLLTSGTHVPQFTVVGVYRRRNARTLLTALGPAIDAGADVRLWALDTPAEALEAWTSGCGAGGRFELLNRLLEDVPSTDFIVVIDDDVEFVSGNVLHLVRFAHRFGTSLTQPSHTFDSASSYGFTFNRPCSAGRITTFVEIGPVVCLSPGIRGEVLPFPEETPMGWGVDVQWTDHARLAQHKFAILDAVRIRHLGSPGDDYTTEVIGREAEATRAALEDRGVSSAGALQQALQTIRPWHLLRDGGP